MAVAHWPRRPPPSARPLSFPSWRALPLPPLLEGVGENVGLAPFRPVPGYGAGRSAELASVKRMAEAVSGILPREDKATAMRVLSLSGKPSASWSGSAISTLIRKVSGLRRYRPGRFVREAAMTNVGSLAGTRRCISPHVFAGRRQAAFRVAAHAPSMPSHKDREKDLEPRPARGHRSRSRLAAGRVGRRRPEGGPKGLRPRPRASRALNPASARHGPAWAYAAGFVRASCSVARPSPSRS